MNKKSFFLGVLTGIVLTFVSLFVIGLVYQKSKDSTIQYLENPVSYENKKETSFMTEVDKITKIQSMTGIALLVGATLHKPHQINSSIIYNI